MGIRSGPLRPLAWTIIASGFYDSVAALVFFFAIGTGRLIDQPPTHSFYAVFLGSFLICFAYLQFLSALNIRLYAFNVGA